MAHSNPSFAGCPMRTRGFDRNAVDYTYFVVAILRDQGGDLIRFVESSQHLSFRQSLTCLE
jgi:hypothetical protein